MSAIEDTFIEIPGSKDFHQDLSAADAMNALIHSVSPIFYLDSYA